MNARDLAHVSTAGEAVAVQRQENDSRVQLSVPVMINSGITEWSTAFNGNDRSSIGFPIFDSSGSGQELPSGRGSDNGSAVERLQAANRRVSELRKKLELLEPSKEKDSYRVKRPRNGFILYCLDERPKLKEEYRGVDNRLLSKMLGLMWNQLSSDEKSPYVAKAAEERASIVKKHPGCRFGVDKTKKVKKRLKLAEEELSSIATSIAYGRCWELEAQVQEKQLVPSNPACAVHSCSVWEKSAEIISLDDSLSLKWPMNDFTQWPMWSSVGDVEVLNDNFSNSIFDSLQSEDRISSTETEDIEQITRCLTDVTANEEQEVPFQCQDWACTGFLSDGLLCTEAIDTKTEEQHAKKFCVDGTRSRKSPKRAQSSLQQQGCRKLYGMDDRERWCSGCKWKKRCRRNLE